MQLDFLFNIHGASFLFSSGAWGVGVYGLHADRYVISGAAAVAGWRAATVAVPCRVMILLPDGVRPSEPAPEGR